MIAPGEDNIAFDDENALEWLSKILGADEYSTISTIVSAITDRKGYDDEY